jgi:hypothetical protein
MPVITETVETPLPVEAAFDYVANFEHIVEWDPGVTAVRKTTDGPPSVGSEYDLDLNYGGSPIFMTYRITEWDPPRRVVLEGDGDRTVAVDRISFSASAVGSSVEYQADIRMKGVYRVAEPFLGRLLRRIGEGAAEGLARRMHELSTEEGS